MITHNPFSVVLLIAPAILVLAKTVELVSHDFLQGIFPSIQWVQFSWRATYLSALVGAFLHLSWDLTMHDDINLGFPFADLRNPFVNPGATALILYASLVLMVPAYLMGRRISRGSVFKKLP